jgi:CrcB protein
MVAFVGFGSAVGGIARYLLSAAIQQRVTTGFPLGTWVINVTGSLMLGFVLRYALETPGISVETRAMLTTGFCGGYTTFSTFSYETAKLLEDGDYRRAALYTLTSVVVALAGMFVGFGAARELLSWRARL